MAGAPKGNTNAAKGRIWHAAIVRALAKRSRGDQVKALDELAEKFLQAVAEGDIAAFKELGDRLDGKPHQSMDLEASGKGGAPLFPSVSVVVDAMKGGK